MTLWNLIACAVIGAIMIGAYRWCHRQSRALAAVVAGGILARCLVGLGLFWISYLHLPFLPSLQMGNGFWVLMLDARGYYQVASVAASSSLDVISPGSASPFFTKTLAVWIDLVGASPAAGLFLNVVLFVAYCVLLTAVLRSTGRWRDDLPLLIAVTAIAASPLVVIHSTQPLKDGLFLLLMSAGCLATKHVFIGLERGRMLPTLAGVAALGVVLFGLAGIRAYYPVIFTGAFAVGVAILILRVPLRQRLPTAAAGTAILSALWLCYWAGAGPDFRPSATERKQFAQTLFGRGPSAGSAPNILLAGIDSARRGFIKAGGATNVAPATVPSAALTTASQTGPADSESGGPSSVINTNRVGAAVTGLAVIFVPVTVLKWLGIVDFTGGRGLLPLADLDTVFSTALVVLALAVVFQRRRTMSEVPFLWFSLTLGLLTSVLLGYVVTNLGTLMRMRYIATLPLLMVVAALPSFRHEASRPDARPGDSSPDARAEAERGVGYRRRTAR